MDVALAVGDAEGEGVRPATPGQALPDGLLHHNGGLVLEGLLELLHLLGQLGVVGLGLRGRRLLHRGQGLSHLAVVPVDGDGLDAHVPRLYVELLDLLDRRLLGHVHGVVVDDPVTDEGLGRGDRDVEHLPLTGITDARHRAEVQVVVHNRLQRRRTLNVRHPGDRGFRNDLGR